MVDDNNNTLYAFGSNKEVSQEIFQLYRKIEYIAPEEKNSLMYLYIKPMYSLVNIMFNNRMQKIAQAPESNISASRVMV